MVTKKTRFLCCGLPAIIGVLVLTACSLTSGLEAWEGHSIDDLIGSWGEPASITRLGQGVEAYTWGSEEEDCQQTFTVRDNTIIGASDTNCSN